MWPVIVILGVFFTRKQAPLEACLAPETPAQSPEAHAVGVSEGQVYPKINENIEDGENY